MQEKIRVIFLGTPDFSCPTLTALVNEPDVEVKLVVTQPDRPRDRGLSAVPTPVKLLALQNNIPVFQPTSLRKEIASFREKVAAYGPFDIGIVIAFGQILPEEVLNTPQMGCVNIHASLLPRWRGAAPIQRAVMAGDKLTGCCLMQMELGLDTGAVFCKSEVAITENQTSGELHNLLAESGAKLLTDNLAAILNSDLVAVPQTTEGITYANKILAEEAAINFSEDAALVAAKVRGLSPFPGAFSRIDTKRVKIFNAVALESIPGEQKDPGSILFAAGDRLEVSCGTGVLSVKELQIEGKKRLRVEEFLRGADRLVGVRLGAS